MKQNIFKGNTLVVRSIAFFIGIVCCFSSCEKDVNIKLASGDPQLVVQGSIETGLPPYVFLTKSIGYFQQIDFNTLQNNFVHGAVITISDGSVTTQLKEYTIDTSSTGNKFYIYTIDTSVLPYMVGQVEKYYKLHISYNGQTYDAITKIPNPTPLDSIFSTYPDPPFDKAKYPDARQIRISFTDPDTAGNYVRYYTQRKNEVYYPGLNSVFSDEIVNGTKFSTTLPMGEMRSGQRSDTSGTANVGDTISFKWTAIDKASYDFWSSYEYSLGSLGNPFSTPVEVKSNISNNALGIWAGYGSLYYTVPIKRN